MKTNLLKSIFISLILVMGVSNANAAYNQAAKDLYFDNSEAKWTNCYVYIGHGSYTSCYDMTRVSGTQYLWQLPANFNGGSSWNSATGWVVCKEKWWAGANESIDKYIWHGDNNVTKKSTSAWVDTKIYKTNGAANATSDGTTKKVYTVTSYDKSNYTVTINTVEGGTLTVKDYDNNAVASGASKIHLTVLKFSATPADGYVLDEVQINNGSTTTTIAAADLATTTHTLTSAVTITPVWHATTSTVTVTATATNGSVTGGGVVEEGTSVTLTATPDAGYQFVNWTVGGAEVSTANPYTFTAEEDVTVVANFQEIPKVTIYFVNNSGWSKIQAYAWEGTKGANPGWPGADITANKLGEQIGGFDVYSYTVEQGSYGKVIFNDGSAQTANFVWTDGKYYYMGAGLDYAGGTKGEVTDAVAPDPLATDVYLAGDMNSWNTTENEFRKATGEATTASVTVELTVKTYEFKLVIDGTWKGNNGTMTRGGNNVHDGGWSFDGDNNCKIVADVAGDYTFTWNLTTNKLTVAYPPLPKYTVTATAENGTVEGDGEYEQGATATLTATPNDGYLFVNWTKGGEVVATTQEYSFTVTEAVELVANFEEAHTVTVSYMCGTTSIKDATTPAVGVETPVSIEAPVIEGYTFQSWTIGDGIETDNANTANPISITTKASGAYTLTAHFEEIPPKTIYLKPNNRWKTDNARFVAYVWNAGGNFWFDMVDEDESGYYTCTIPSKYSNLTFVRMDPSKPDNNWDNDWNQTGDLTIPLDDKNCFTLAESAEWNGATETWSIYTPTVPYALHDYRLVYIESEVLGETPYTKFHPAHAITKQATGTKLDTVSFYINKTSGQNPAILLQRCSNIEDATITWEDITIQSINGNNGANPAAALAPAKKSAELHIGNGCPAVTENAVYNFILQQDNGTATILGEYTHPYVGNYYIRTNCADGGWSKYTTNSDNLMTYSETALKQPRGYDYYFCKWVANAGYNVRYTVANDYSHCVSDTLIGDNIASDGNLPAPANVRFTWNSNTNHLERAYISGSTNVSDRFLVLEGNAYLKDADGNAFDVPGLHSNEANFKDMGNWLYQVDVKASEETLVKLTAKYNGKIQFFKGAADATVPIITGAGNEYKFRLIYDFKTNYLLCGLTEDGEISENISVDEAMIMRSHHELAQTFDVTNAGSIKTIKTIYGVMNFNKTDLNDGDKSQYERALYWVSFPFNVNLGEAFGFGNYGEHWIMEYYDGEARAKNGWWVDSDTYWKYITNPNYILEAGKGYVLCLDLDLLKESASLWTNTDDIALYFPSNDGNITIDSNPALKETKVDAWECTIKRDDRETKDSNWNIIGVAGYKNFPDINTQGLRFYYEYFANSNTYEVNMAAEFNCMHAYMVQFAGTIEWGANQVTPKAIAARKQSSGKDQYTLRLALQQEGTDHDHTFIRLQEDNVTDEFDMNYDLCKIINSGANIYSMIGNVEVAANVLPVEECVISLGLDIEEGGNYTFAMPDGTDGITATLIDYETGKETNLLLADYTVELNAGIDNERFALRLRPSYVATEVENTILTDGNDNVKKYIIDGALYLLRDGKLYDAQGRMIQQ